MKVRDLHQDFGDLFKYPGQKRLDVGGPAVALVWSTLNYNHFIWGF